MADKIKKFFQKKKVEAKFKMAGPGHRLSEASISTQSSADSSASVHQPANIRSGPRSAEAAVAAEAALARLQCKRDNPAFNTGLAAIQAAVRKELELERAARAEEGEAQPAGSGSGAGPGPGPTAGAPAAPTEAPNYAAAGVYFRCPIIGNDVLPRDEWKKKIKEFLYEQLEEERGLTACLIIHSCNNNKEKVDLCVETLCKYLENIVNNPDEEKYQKIRMSNRVFTERVLPIEGALDLLQAAGFSHRVIANSEGTEEEYLVFDKELVPSLEYLTTLIDALRSASPVSLELDRCRRVLLPSQATRVHLPPDFYAITPEELKRELRLRAEAIEKSQMLRTKAMREKEEMREMRRYRFCIIRVRFPDGILLQGTFSIYERYSDIYAFVAENLEYGDLPFVLTTPTGQRLTAEEDGDKTLIDLRLVPATVLTFAWHPTVMEAVGSSPNKDVYLTAEVMMTVQEV